RASAQAVCDGEVEGGVRKKKKEKKKKRKKKRGSRAVAPLPLPLSSPCLCVSVVNRSCASSRRTATHDEAHRHRADRQRLHRALPCLWLPRHAVGVSGGVGLSGALASLRRARAAG